MEGGSERMAAGLTRLKAAAAGGKGRFLLATFQVRRNVCAVQGDREAIVGRWESAQWLPRY